MSCYLVQEEDGTSRFELEEATGFLVQEDCIPVPPAGSAGGVAVRGRRRPLEDILAEDEEDALNTILITM